MSKSIRVYDKEYPSLLRYPFKSKYKFINDYLQKVYKSDIKTEPFVKDFKLKSCKELSKPNFSNEPGCWEADLMFIRYYDKDLTKEKNIYLVLINVNTRYLIVEPIKDKAHIWFALERIIMKHPQFLFNVIKCDGEPGFIEMKDNNVIIRFPSGETTFIFDLDEIIKAEYKYDKQLQQRTKEAILVKHNIEALRDLLKQNDYYKPRIKRLFNFQQIVQKEIQNEYPKGFPQDYPQDYCDLLKSKCEKIVYNSIIDSITEFYPLKFIINSSPYALSHKNVDSVIRTLRNAFGLDDRRLSDYNLMRQMVDYYNNTPHGSLRFKNIDYIDNEFYDKNLKRPSKWIYYTPSQMQNDIDLEWKYIRKMQMKLREIHEKQHFKGLLSYKKGNIILVHLDKSKTQKKHEKRRRVFNEIAEFIEYRNGNTICRLLKPYQTVNKKDSTKGRKPMTDNEKAIIEVPIIYTKFVCNLFNDLNDDYIKYFGI